MEADSQKKLPNLKIYIDNTEEEEEYSSPHQDSSENENVIHKQKLREKVEDQDRTEDDISPVEFRVRLRGPAAKRQREPKRYENRSGAFVTGINITDKKEKARKEKRAKRFGIPAEKKPNVDLPGLYRSLGIHEDDLAQDERGIRLEALHFRGLDNLNTNDVFTYFQEFGPSGVEWIDDNSCNVVWIEALTAARAMLKQSLSYNDVMGFQSLDDQDFRDWNRSGKIRKDSHRRSRNSTNPGENKLQAVLSKKSMDRDRSRSLDSKRNASSDQKKKKHVSVLNRKTSPIQQRKHRSYSLNSEDKSPIKKDKEGNKQERKHVSVLNRKSPIRKLKSRSSSYSSDSSTGNVKQKRNKKRDASDSSRSSSSSSSSSGSSGSGSESSSSSDSSSEESSDNDELDLTEEGNQKSKKQKSKSRKQKDKSKGPVAGEDSSIKSLETSIPMDIKDELIEDQIPKDIADDRLSVEVEEKKNKEKEAELDMEEGEIMDTDEENSLDKLKKSSKSHTEPSKDSNIPWPPGKWRLGVPFQKAKYLFLRFATKADKKVMGAQQFSKYYQKYGNPNYSGMRGLLSGSRRRKLNAARLKHDMQDEMRSVQAAVKSDRTLVSYEDDIFGNTQQTTEEDKEDTKVLANQETEPQKDMTYSDGESDKNIESGPEEWGEEETKMEVYKEVDEEAAQMKEELERLLGSPPKKRTMRMYADDLEEEIKAKKAKKTAVSMLPVVDAESADEFYYPERPMRDARHLINRSKRPSQSSHEDLRNRLGRRKWKDERNLDYSAIKIKVYQ